MKEVVCQVENSRSIGNPSTTGSNTESIMMTLLPDANTAGFFAICIEKNELLHACIVCNVYNYQY